MLFAHGSYQRLSSVSAYCRKYRTFIFSAFNHNSYCVFNVDYQSVAKPKSVAKIMITNFGLVPDWLCQKPAGQWAYNVTFSNCQHPAKYTQQQIIRENTVSIFKQGKMLSFVPWRLNLRAAWMFVQQLVQANDEEATKAPHHWPFVSLGFFHKGPVILENVSMPSHPHVIPADILFGTNFTDCRVTP